MQTPLQQLQQLDISTLSTFQDFANVMKQLNQIENPEIVQHVKQQLANNPNFQRFQQETQQKPESPRESSASSRLAALMAEKKVEKASKVQANRQQQAVQNGLNFTNYHAMAAAFNEILNIQGSAGLNQVYIETLEKINFSHLQQGLTQFEQVNRATQDAILNADKTPEPLSSAEQAKRNKTQEKVIKKAEEHHAEPQQIAKMQFQMGFTNFIQDHPTLARILFHPKKRDENGNPEIKQGIKARDFLVFREKMDEIYGEQPNSNTLKELDARYGEGNGRKVWEERKMAYQQYLALYSIESIVDIVESLKKGAKNSDAPIKVKRKELDQLFDIAFKDAFTKLNGKNENMIVDNAIRQLQTIKGQTSGQEFNVVNMEFEQFGLYYANSQKIMAEKGLSFAEFLQTKDADKFGVARQLLASELIKQVDKLSPEQGERFLKELGVDVSLGKVALQAYREIKGDKEIMLQVQAKANKDYRGGISLISWGVAEYHFSKDGVEMKLDLKQEREREQMERDNPNWKDELVLDEIAQKNGKFEKDVEEKTTKHNQSDLSEDMPVDDPINKFAEIKDYDKQVMKAVAGDGREIQINNEYSAPKISL